MINRLLYLINRSRSAAKLSKVSSSSDQPPSSNGNLFFFSVNGQIGPKKGAKWFPFDRGEGVKLFGQCPNRQGTFQKGASPSSSFICYINDNIALLQSIREASDISCFNFSPVRKPGILNENQYC